MPKNYVLFDPKRHMTRVDKAMWSYDMKDGHRFAYDTALQVIATVVPFRNCEARKVED